MEEKIKMHQKVYKNGIKTRWHNKRLILIRLANGDFMLKYKRMLMKGEEFVPSENMFLIRNKILVTIITLSPEALFATYNAIKSGFNLPIPQEKNDTQKS